MVVLGKYPEYMEKAKEVGGRVFHVPNFKSYTENEIWKANKKFLKRAIKASEEILLVSAEITGFYKQEINYLERLNYKKIRRCI